jgi:4-hydroxy-tetrahydrodipicolinate reductase
MTTRIIVNGASGKMGKITAATIKNQTNFSLVAETGRSNNLANIIRDTGAEIVIDFTVPAVVFENTKTIIEAGARPVVGTTGLTLDQIKQLKMLCEEKSLGGIIAPNFSLSAILMMKYAKDAVKYFPDAEIIEMHHAQKVDAPSGTALKTYQLMLESNPDLKKNNKEMPIHSVRLPGFFSHQEVIFGGVGETLTIRHDAIDRTSMMPGVVIACHKVLALQSLIYGMEHIL